jgi:hypothetical protein
MPRRAWRRNAAEKLIIEKPDPVYPPFAKQTKTQGTVKIDITVQP